MNEEIAFKGVDPMNGSGGIALDGLETVGMMDPFGRWPLPFHADTPATRDYRF